MRGWKRIGLAWRVWRFYYGTSMIEAWMIAGRIQ